MSDGKRWATAGLGAVAGLAVAVLVTAVTSGDDKASGKCGSFETVTVQVSRVSLEAAGEEGKSWATARISADPVAAHLGRDVGIKVKLDPAMPTDVSAKFAGLTLQNGKLFDKLDTKLSADGTEYTVCAKAGSVPSKGWTNYSLKVEFTQKVNGVPRTQKLNCDPTIINDAAGPGSQAGKVCMP